MGKIYKNGVPYNGVYDLMVHVTYTNGSGYAVDHTYEEIVQNINAGGTPILEYRANGGTPTYYPLTGVLSTHVAFTRTTIGGTGQFLVYASGGVAYSVAPLTQTTTVTVAASAWTNGQATLSWSSSLNGANAVLLGYPANTTAADYEIMRAADIRVVGQTASAITIEALGTVPTSDLTFQLTRW